ncbi:MAG TPA: acetate kinase, partial [Bacteroidetes bacterium]|nr:acetate kinase [Bacteroidota bacterium]
ISGVSSDMRDIETEAASGHKRAQLALDVFTYRLKKYIGAYAAAMGGLDTIVFTGGIGENSATVRSKTCQNLEFLGVKIDEQKNKETVKQEAVISAEDSRVKVLVVPTNEELVIALDTAEIVEKTKQGEEAEPVGTS